MSLPGKILIIRLSSLGDILHALPAFECLRQSFPEARIDWMVERKMSFLLSAVPGIDHVYRVDLKSLRGEPFSQSLWRQNWSVIRAVRSIRYDVSIDFQGLIKTGFLSWISRASRRIGFSSELVRERPAHWFYSHTLPKPDHPLHVTVLNKRLAALAGAGILADAVQFSISPNDCLHVQDRLQLAHVSDYVILNPGGGWPTKRWSPRRYGELAQKIHAELGLQVVITTGPGEDSLFNSVSEACGDAPLHHFPVSFLQLIPLLRSARLFVGGDTGPFHLACALRVPVVGIFGPTAPVRNGPWSDVDEALTRVLPCSFCGGRTCPTRIECMDIPVEEVLGAVRNRIQRRH